MIQYIIRRVLLFIPVLISIAAFTFFLVRKMPGGPFDFVGDRQLPEAVVANIEAKYHLDWPQWKQFVSYMIGDELFTDEGSAKGIIRGDFGLSLYYRDRPVSDIIKGSLPISMQLGFMSLLFALIIGIPAGTIAALKQNTWIDYASTLGAVFFMSVPNMVLGPVLIWILALKLGWLKVAGWGSQSDFVLGFLPNPSDWNLDYIKLAIMPVFALGTGASAGIARLTRASLLQVIREDYIRTAWAKGLRSRTVVVVHALKNSMIPVITVLGPMFAGLLTGTFIVEQIFGINGLGKHFVTSIGNRDYSILMGVTLLFSVFLIIANLLVDIAYGFLDPRIRFD